MSAPLPYVVLRWRRPAALFVPLGLLAAAAPGGLLALRLPVTAAAGLCGVLALVLAVSLLLCRRRDRTMPVLIATTLSVTHAGLFLGGVTALGVPAAGEGVRALAARLGADAVASSPSASVLAAYLAGFLALPILTGGGLVALRYLALTRRPA